MFLITFFIGNEIYFYFKFIFCIFEWINKKTSLAATGVNHYFCDNILPSLQTFLFLSKTINFSQFLRQIIMCRVFHKNSWGNFNEKLPWFALPYDDLYQMRHTSRNRSPMPAIRIFQRVNIATECDTRSRGFNGSTVEILLKIHVTSPFWLGDSSSAG